MPEADTIEEKTFQKGGKKGGAAPFHPPGSKGLESKKGMSKISG